MAMRYEAPLLWPPMRKARPPSPASEDAAARRRGVARALLAELEGAARRFGYRELWLETGTEQPEAIALYESAGYLPVPPFDPHDGQPRAGDPCLVQHDSRSRFFGRRL